MSEHFAALLTAFEISYNLLGKVGKRSGSGPMNQILWTASYVLLPEKMNGTRLNYGNNAGRDLLRLYSVTMAPTISLDPELVAKRHSVLSYAAKPIQVHGGTQRSEFKVLTRPLNLCGVCETDNCAMPRSYIATSRSHKSCC